MGGVFVLFFQFLPSDTNTRLFHLQRNKLDMPGWLFFLKMFVLKDESASTEFPQPGLLLLCIGLKTLTSAVRLIYSTKGVKSVYSCLNSVLNEQDLELKTNDEKKRERPFFNLLS